MPWSSQQCPACPTLLFSRDWRLRYVLSTALSGILLLSPLLALGADSLDETRRLEQLKSQIGGVKREISQSQKERTRLDHKLRDIEQRINQVSRKLRASLAREKDLQRELDKLAKQQEALSDKVNGHQQTLAQHARSRYLLGEQGYLKLFLNQQDPGSMNRALSYYQYLSQAHLQGINVAEEELQALEQIKQDKMVRRIELHEIQAQHAEQKQQLEKEQATRKQLLAALNSEILSKEQQLQQLAADAKQLEQIIEEIKQKKAAQLTSTFGKNKGQLPWPAQGRLLARFGQSRDLGKLKWNGVLIGAPEGSAVKAIANGKVVFADWLRGFGLLIIIDHGAGNLSLYGHNQSLQKEVGDIIEQGQVIAFVGNSGGNEHSGLYFEVRHKGKPSDPTHWCRGSSPS